MWLACYVMLLCYVTLVAEQAKTVAALTRQLSDVTFALHGPLHEFLTPESWIELCSSGHRSHRGLTNMESSICYK